jgi:hypothetical protein
MKVVVYIVVMLLVGCVMYLAQKVTKKLENYSMMHVPPGGCPPNTQYVKDMFHLDGKEIPGCFNPNGNGMIDVLRPGESIELHFSIKENDEKIGG